MKGNITEKKNIILQLASLLEPKRNQLKEINHNLEDILFYCFNNLNIRHENITPGTTNFKARIKSMGKNELEKWYDEVYQLCLLAFLEIDNKERIIKVKQLKDEIEKC